MSIQQPEENAALLASPAYDDPNYQPSHNAVPVTQKAPVPQNGFIPYAGTYIDVGQNFVQPRVAQAIPIGQPPAYSVSNPIIIHSATSNYVTCCSVFIIIISAINIIYSIVYNGENGVTGWIGNGFSILCGIFGLAGVVKKRPAFVRIYYIFLIIAIILNIISTIILLSTNALEKEMEKACEDPKLHCTEESMRNIINYAKVFTIFIGLVVPLICYGSCALLGFRYERYLRAARANHSLED